MAITQAMTTSFKLEILDGVHDLNTDVIKIALYTSAAVLGRYDNGVHYIKRDHRYSLCSWREYVSWRDYYNVRHHRLRNV